MGENGRAAFAETDSPTLDFFTGVVPNIGHDALLKLLCSAWNHDPHTTLRLIFQTGNIRDQGKMDRRTFLICIYWLWIKNPETVLQNIDSFKEHTCLKDLLALLRYSIASGTGFCRYNMESIEDSIENSCHKKRKDRGCSRNIESKKRRKLSRLDRKERFAASLEKPLNEILKAGGKEDVQQYMREISMKSGHYNKMVFMREAATHSEPVALTTATMKGVSYKDALTTATMKGMSYKDELTTATMKGMSYKDELTTATMKGMFYKDFPHLTESAVTTSKKRKFPKAQPPTFPKVEWISKDIKFKWDEFVHREEVEQVKTTRTLAQNKKRNTNVMTDEVVAANMNEFIGVTDTLTKRLFDAVVDVFANGLTVSFIMLCSTSTQGAKLETSYAKWAPSLEGADAKSIPGIVDAIAQRVIKNVGFATIETAITTGVLVGKRLQYMLEQGRLNEMKSGNYNDDSMNDMRIVYAHILSKLRQTGQVPEHFVGKNEFSKVDYNFMPSLCRKIWGKNVFRKNDEVRYEKFIEDAKQATLAEIKDGICSNETPKVHTGALMAHHITTEGHKAYLDVKRLTREVKTSNKNRAKRGEDGVDVALSTQLFQAKSMKDQANMQWHNMLSSIKKNMESITDISAWVPICDVSASMMWDFGDTKSMDVAIALSLVLASVNTIESGWNGTLFTFSSEPKLVTVIDKNEAGGLLDIGKLVQITKSIEAGGSTNIDATLDLFLKHSLKIQTNPSDMERQALVIFSDMEFDTAMEYDDAVTDQWVTAHETIVKKFRNAGYPTPPNIIYWNLRASPSVVVHGKDTPGVALLAGFSQGMLKCFLGRDITACCAEQPIPPETPNLIPETTPKARMTPLNTMNAVLDQEVYTKLTVATCDYASQWELVYKDEQDDEQEDGTRWWDVRIISSV
jgi:Domain of unknown function (DUF2828)